ncbi:MAG: hypothetical protein U9Q88_02715 [Bacillota bacterium]|nr:hypothetical protein [Bacillota bacterium]
MAARKDTNKKYANLHMNPIVPNKDVNGEYYPESVKKYKRSYEATLSHISIREKEREKLLSKIVKYETSTRSRFHVLLHKSDKDENDHVELNYRIQGVEELYNKLYLCERELRDLDRFKTAVYPQEIVDQILKGENQ